MAMTSSVCWIVTILKKRTERPSSCCQRIQGRLASRKCHSLWQAGNTFDSLGMGDDALIPHPAEVKQLLLLCHYGYSLESSRWERLGMFLKTNSVHLRVLEKCQSQIGHFSPPLPFSTWLQALVGAEGQAQGLSRVRQMPYHWVTPEVLASCVLKCSHDTFHLRKRLTEKYACTPICLGD